MLAATIRYEKSIRQWTESEAAREDPGPELRASAERAAQESGNAGIKPWAGPSALRGTWLFSALFGIPTPLRSWPPRDDIPATI
jgi:hypothetical protein